MDTIIDDSLLKSIYQHLSNDEKEKLSSTLKELRMSEERYRIATENSSDIIIEYDILDNSIYHTTSRVENLYNISQTIDNAPEYLIKNGLVLPEYADIFRETFQKVCDGEPSAECTIQTRNSAGNILWNTVTLTTIYNAMHQPIRAVGILKDITPQKEAELRYENEVLYRNAIMQDALLSYEADLTHKKVLAGVTELLQKWGVPYTDDYETVLGYIGEHLIHKEDRKVILSSLSAESLLSMHSLGQDKLEIEYRRRSSSKESRWSKCIVYLTDDLRTMCVRAFYYIHDIHEAKIKELALQEKAEHDLLTGLYNKGTTESLIKNVIESSRATQQSDAFMIIDLDDFKTINDQLGHAFGDAVLSEMAQKIQSMCRKDDIAGRIGGDEFVLYLRNISDRKVIEHKAQSICDLFHDAYSGALKDYKISGTVGVSLLPDHGDTFEQLYRKADLALYAAKGYGKDTFCVYHDKIQPADAAKLSRAAIDRSSGKTFSENIIEYVFRILYESRDIQRAVIAILELVSNHFEYIRGYIYEMEESGKSCHLSFEWCAPGTEPLGNDLRTISGKDFEAYQKHFDRGELHITHTHNKNQTEPAIQIKYALNKKGSFKGFMGFDRKDNNSTLDHAEISVLQVVTQMLDVFLAQEHTNNKLTQSSTMLQAVVDSLDTCTYIIDLDTYTLYFVNQSTANRLPAATVGKYCYETIRNTPTPCEDCPITMLLQKNISSDTSCRTALYYPSYDSWFNVDASLIKLGDGKNYGLINCYYNNKIK